MNAIKKTTFALIVTLCVNFINGSDSDKQQGANAAPKQRTVEDFLKQFVTLFRQSYYGVIDPSVVSRERPKQEYPDEDLDNFPGRPPLRPPPMNPAFGVRPEPPYPPYPPRPIPPFVPHGYPPGPFPPGANHIPRPYPPFGFRPVYGNGYPQNSLFAALDSISRYDDLRCVPRLLCEVTTGSHSKMNRPGYPSKNLEGDGSPVPFLSRDALIALLTVLNFVDDSPLLSFARAAFLGYSSRGDTRACLTAYPTCPRDPDQLIDYLNNHNGGFFRFFNQQLQQQPQYAPQYQQFLQKYQQHRHEEQTKFPLADEESITPRYPYANQQLNPHSRILNDPIDIQYVSDKIPTRRPKLLKQQSKIIFENADQDVEPQLLEHVREIYQPVRKGKKFIFPERFEKLSSHTMIFPNRTGTGNLILSSDVDGHLKILFEDDALVNRIRTSKTIKFQTDRPPGQRSKRKMKFPEAEKF